VPGFVLYGDQRQDFPESPELIGLILTWITEIVSQLAPGPDDRDTI
jgi:hypothetical protein